MAIIITGAVKNPDTEEWHTPLIELDPLIIKADWSNNAYIINQLRSLADMIETNDPKIISISLKIQHDLPFLALEIYAGD